MKGIKKKKLKICFVDFTEYRSQRYPEMWKTPYSTFYGYDFDTDIQTKVSQLYGWSTDIEQLINSHSIELHIHIITDNFLLKKGVVQKFSSKHGPRYDDMYCYLEGMNVLAVEGVNLK